MRWFPFLLLTLLAVTPALAAPRLATLSIPGPPELGVVARDVMDVQFSVDPSVASNAGLFDDAARVPELSPEARTALVARLEHDQTAMRAMPWRTWPVDAQIDFRWLYANAEVLEHELTVEKIFEHRPGAWLEPTANNLIAFVTYAPERTDVEAAVLQKIPAMLDEARAVCTHPTAQDVKTALGLIDGLTTMIGQLAVDKQPALDALAAYRKELAALHGLPEVQMVGAQSYAWRLQHAELLPWTPQQLLALAHAEEKRVEAKLAQLKPRLAPTPPPTAAEQKQARELTLDGLLALYNRIEELNRKALEQSGVVTLPQGLGPIRARQTPDAMVPLTGDGGSMNPPPPYGASDVGWWNVEHFHASWNQQQRLEEVLGATRYRTNGMGPYAAHEGVPGHHLQLSIARLQSDPIRSVLADSVENEGWALYAETMFWKSGGLGHSRRAEYDTLDSYLYRIRRVVYDVNLETGAWTLQQAADYKHHAAAGKGKIDEDICRSFNWPTQLICYFSGRTQIVQLKADCQRKWGKAWSDRRFHDAFLSLGSIPIVFARAKLLGEPVPDLQEKSR
ncbi:MAG: DUF885 family protein [Candidatus Xenobia bacterium]